MIVVPSTAPSSYAVSDTALAAPAFAGGALARISSFETVSAAPMPTPSETNATMSSGRAPVLGADGDEQVAEDREAERDGHDDARRDALGDRHDADAGDDHRQQSGHEREPGLERRQTDDQLQVLRDEVQEADEPDDAQQVDQHRAGEGPAAEQRHVEHGRLEAVLAAHEEHAEHEPGDDEHERQRALGAVHRELLDRVDDRHHGRQRQHDAQRIEPAGIRVAALGHEDRHEHQQRHEHGNGHEEHRPPGEVLEQDAADDGPSAAPAEKPAAHTAIAMRRWSRLVKMLRRSDSVDGISIAPNTPIAARAAISHSALGAKAASAETRPNPVAPMSSIRRRPNRSPSTPIVTSRLASTSG